MLVSSASIWEMAVKIASGKIAIDVPLADVAQTFDAIGISHAHAMQVAALPGHHHDPFDRMLVAQALVEGLTIVTRDRMIPRYGARVLTA